MFARYQVMVSGISPVRALRESLGLSVAQRTQAGSLMANGAQISWILSSPPNVTAPNS